MPATVCAIALVYLDQRTGTSASPPGSIWERRGIRFAPVELAWQFSFEGDEAYGVTWSGQFGFHGLRWTDISPWLRANPDVQIDSTLGSAS